MGFLAIDVILLARQFSFQVDGGVFDAQTTTQPQHR